MNKRKAGFSYENDSMAVVLWGVPNLTPRDLAQMIGRVSVKFDDTEGKSHTENNILSVADFDFGRVPTWLDEKEGMQQEFKAVLSIPKGSEKSVISGLENILKREGIGVEKVSIGVRPTMRRGSMDVNNIALRVAKTVIRETVWEYDDDNHPDLSDRVASINRKADTGDAVMYFNVGQFVDPPSDKRMMSPDEWKPIQDILQDILFDVSKDVQKIVKERLKRDRRFKKHIEKTGIRVLASKKTARSQQLMTQAIKRDLPELYSQEKEKDPIVYAKFFNPYGSGTWLATEFDGRDTFFGAVNLGHGWELGYFSLRELESQDAAMGGKTIRGLQGIERDKYFRPMPLSRAKNA